MASATQLRHTTGAATRKFPAIAEELVRWSKIDACQPLGGWDSPRADHP
jgi:hypothetical protein